MTMNGDSTHSLAKRSGIPQRTVANVLSGNHKISVEAADTLAAAYGLDGWHLLLPDLPADLTQSKKIGKLYRQYLSSSKTGREHIELVADREAEYASKSDTPKAS